jgi:hypothetical protein
MRHTVLLLVGLVCFGRWAVAADAVPRMSGDDLAVLDAIIRDDCTDAKRRPILVADVPEDARERELPDEGNLERRFGAAHRARNSERSRWPLTSLCTKVRVESKERIDAFFARDKRIPPGWEGFDAEFRARSYLTISRPAYSADRRHAFVSLGSHCGELCGSGHLIELEKKSDGWRIVRSVGTWIS